MNCCTAAPLHCVATHHDPDAGMGRPEPLERVAEEPEEDPRHWPGPDNLLQMKSAQAVTIQQHGDGN